MAERECENIDGNAKGLSGDGAHAKKKRKYFTSSFKANEKYSVANSAPSTSRVCAVNFACQAHCFNLREKLIGIVCFLCYPVF